MILKIFLMVVEKKEVVMVAVLKVVAVVEVEMKEAMAVVINHCRYHLLVQVYL